MTDYYIYKYTNKMNNKSYIGATKLKQYQRAGKNGKNYKVCPSFYAAITEYGWQNFEYVVLENNLTLEESELKEQKYIEQYRSNESDFGYNIQIGGRHLYGENNMFYGKTHNKKTRAAVAEANKRRVWTEETISKMKEKLSGQNSKCKRSVICVETNKCYISLSEAARDTGARVSKISAVLNGARKTAGGYHWQLANL